MYNSGTRKYNNVCILKGVDGKTYLNQLVLDSNGKVNTNQLTYLYDKSTRIRLADVSGGTLSEVNINTSPIGNSDNTGSGSSGVGSYGGPFPDPPDISNYGSNDYDPALIDANNDPRHADHMLVADKMPAGDGSDVQVGAMCSFKVIEVVNKYFGRIINSGAVANHYGQSKGLTLMQTLNVMSSAGISPEDFDDLLNYYFDTGIPADYAAMKAAIDNGTPLVGSIQQNNSGHAIFITGYNNDGSWKYYDPQLGKYQTTSEGHFFGVRKINNTIPLQ